MRKKRFFKIALAIFNISFLAGAAISLIQIDINKYLSQHLFNLALIIASKTLNKVIFIGLLIVFLIVGLSFLWQAYFSKLFKIEIKVNRPLLLKLTKRVFLIIILIFLLAEAIISIKREGFFNIHKLLVRLLIIFLFLYLALQIRKAGILQAWGAIKKVYY